MKKILVVFLICILTVFTWGCEKSDNEKQADSTEEVGAEVIEGVEGNTEYENSTELFEKLFDINNVVSIQIEISDEELEKLQQDYVVYDTKNSKSPIYRVADKVTISVGDEVYEIEEVGIRHKGNTSYVPVYDRNTGKLNLAHYRLSFNETFDDEKYYGEDAKVWETEEERQGRKDRRFATLKTLEVKWNKNYDNTHVREIYAYDMYRAMGVMAQHVNLCSLGVNSENYGVVNIYEPVDSEFIRKNLPEEDAGGDLYKCGWSHNPANFVKEDVTYGIEDKDTGASFNYELKTNKKNSVHADFENLLNVIGDSNITKENFESVVDTEYLAKFMAVSYFAGNPDDYRNNYNNYYVYFLKSSGKAVLIPFDYDRCMGITYSWNPDGTGMTWVSPYSDKAEALGKEQENLIVRQAILDQKFIETEYQAALDEVRGSEWLTTEKFEEYYEIAKLNYEGLITPTVDFENAYEDQFRFSLEENAYQDGADYSNMSFEKYVTDITEYYDSCVNGEDFS